MVTHLILFRPRPSLTATEREGLADVMRIALRDIPTIRRARIGRRFTHGRPYEPLMTVDFPYMVVLEFDNLAGLTAYLEHPSHEQLATRFFESFEEALIYDYELDEGTAAIARLR